MSGTVCIGVIAPHGDLAIAEACGEDERGLAVATQGAMDEMGRRVAAAAPDAVVVATPHNVHVTGHMAVVTASRLSGSIEEAADPLPAVWRADRDLALAVLGEMEASDVPTVGVSFGGNQPAEAVAPLDWGGHIPVWHIERHLPDIPVVVVSPARDLDADAHVRAGRAIVRAAHGVGRRIAFVASADQGHGHSADGPYGFAPESAIFDARVEDAVRRGTLGELVEYDASEVNAALADSWWQMVMLHGALEEDGRHFVARFLAYEAPTYFGMLTAVFEPRTSAVARTEAAR
jgi:aromatic ring-opening dioxygenase LigB subunit